MRTYPEHRDDNRQRQGEIEGSIVERPSEAQIANERHSSTYEGYHRSSEYCIPHEAP